MATATSTDGTDIAYQRIGAGPALVLVGGGLDDGSENGPLAEELAGDFTVYNYARRGRSPSGDRRPYAVERELDDLAAIISDAGGVAHVFAVSSGGALALLAAAAEVAIDRLAVYDVPYLVDDDMVAAWEGYVSQLTHVLTQHHHDKAIALFMELAGASEADIEAARESEFWPPLQELAPTLAYDAACLGDGRPPLDRLRRVTRPVLAATGGVADPHMENLPAGLFDAAADTIADAIATAERCVVPGTTHVPDPQVLGPILREFFTRTTH